MVALSGVPLGPLREKWNGAGTALGGPLRFGGLLCVLESGSPPSAVRPPRWVVTPPSPAMKKVSEPCFISCGMSTPFRSRCAWRCSPQEQPAVAQIHLRTAVVPTTYRGTATTSRTGAAPTGLLTSQDSCTAAPSTAV